MGQDGESAAYVLDELPIVFSIDELEARLEILISEFDTRQDAHTIARHHRSIAALQLRRALRRHHRFLERVLWPVMSAEAHGMEDARFVLFTESDGGRPRTSPPTRRSTACISPSSSYEPMTSSPSTLHPSSARRRRIRDSRSSASDQRAIRRTHSLRQ